jgi:iron complex transport system substrate-binding protein
MGFNVLHIDPKNLSEVFDSVHRLGQLVGMQGGAELVVQRMRLKIDEVAKRVEGGSMRPRVYAEEWHKPPFACGNWIPELIQLAGGESLLKEGRSREVALEEVKAFDPHYMIVTWCGFGERAQAELIRYREGWEDVYAVKNGRVFVFDDSYLNRPGPRLVEGLELLARTIHPEMFS